MEINELLEIGAKLFRNSNLSGEAGSNLDMGSIISALSGLTGGDKGFDVGALVNNLDTGGLGDIAKSWLGDGDNKSISPEQIKNVLGPDKLAEFASKLGVSPQEAEGGLSEALPQMVDKASSGGSLLDSLGGVEGVLGMANKLFSR